MTEKKRAVFDGLKVKEDNPEPLPPFEWVEVEIFGQKGEICVHAANFSKNAKAIRLARIKPVEGKPGQFELDMERLETLHIVGACYQGEPTPSSKPDPVPALCAMEDTPAVRYWQECLPLPVFQDLVGAYNRVSGYDRDEENFSEAPPEPSSES